MINSRFCGKTHDRYIFLLVSSCHVGAHLDGLQHGVSKQISTILGKTFLQISCLRKIAVTWILSRGFAYLPWVLSFLRFWTLSIERFWLLFWSISNGVTLKTSNIIIVLLLEHTMIPGNTMIIYPIKLLHWQANDNILFKIKKTN